MQFNDFITEYGGVVSIILGAVILLAFIRGFYEMSKPIFKEIKRIR